jgi:signal transduction histidine kinase
MVTLARAQERQLRTWLYQTVPTDAADRLSTAVREAADRVEADFDVPVEVVTVGDVPMDDAMRAMVAAAGEALTNAAKHAGVERISVYVEVGDDRVEVFVVDQGDGFDVSAVDDDRRGISESIVGRMERHGGTGAILSQAGEGTEVQLTMPRERS